MNRVEVAPADTFTRDVALLDQLSKDPVGELEKPHGQWNVLELVVDHDRIMYFVNGKLAILGTNANTTQGKILFQCEGSEVYFRKMKIALLK